MENKTQFIDFLLEAKKNTYAGDGKYSAPSRPGSKDLAYEEGEYIYIDTYLGSLDFIGEEAVWRQHKPIWGMNYYGVMLTNQIPDGFVKCLKGALRNAPNEAPFRGPASYQDGDLEYTCSWKGDIDRFEGEEQIWDGNKEIYRLVFHGGSIR